MPSKGLAVLTAALTIGIAGCGGSSGPTRAGLIKEADEICDRAKVSVTQFVSANRDGARASPDAMAQFVLGIVDNQEAFVRRLKRLEPPASMKADYRAYLATWSSMNKLQRQVVAAAAPSAAGEIEPGSKAAKLSDRRTELAHKAVDQAKAIGFKSCGG